MTRYIAVFENKMPIDFTNAVWRPWINCGSDLSLLPQMAVHRHMRDRGGLAEDQKKLKLFVCIRDTMEIPAVVDFTEFNVWPKEIT